jgi:hypothetical protein
MAGNPGKTRPDVKRSTIIGGPKKHQETTGSRNEKLINIIENEKSWEKTPSEISGALEHRAGFGPFLSASAIPNTTLGQQKRPTLRLALCIK